MEDVFTPLHPRVGRSGRESGRRSGGGIRREGRRREGGHIEKAKSGSEWWEMKGFKMKWMDKPPLKECDRSVEEADVKGEKAAENRQTRRIAAQRQAA